MALVKMAEEFGGLPMESLIGGPLQAACDAQTMLAGATARFIEEVGLVKEGDKQVVRTVGFSFTRSANGDDGNGPASEKVEMNIPLLAMVKVPSLSIDLVDITFDMEVKSSETQSEIDDKKGELEAEMGLQIGPFSMKAKVKGSSPAIRKIPVRVIIPQNIMYRSALLRARCRKVCPVFWISSIRRSTPQVSRKLRQQEHRGKNIIQLIMTLPDEV